MIMIVEYQSVLQLLAMENTVGLENGRSWVRVLFAPLYVWDSKLVCSYLFHGKDREIYLPDGALKKAFSLKGKSIISVEATIEKVFDGMVLCKIDDYEQHLLLAEEDLDFAMCQ